MAEAPYHSGLAIVVSDPAPEPPRYLGRRVVVFLRASGKEFGRGTITRAWVWTGGATETPHGVLPWGALSRAEVTLESGEVVKLDARTAGEHVLDWER